MTAREVYRKQDELREAQVKLSNLAGKLDDAARSAAARGHTPTTNWMDSPEYRGASAQVHAMEEEVARAQAEVGGKVYRVPGYKVGDLFEKVEKVARRARKLGVGEVSVTVAEREQVEIKGSRVTRDGMVLASEYAYVVLAGEPPVLAGWRFLATLQHLGGANVVKRIPGQARAWVEHRAGRDGFEDGADEAAKRAQEQVDAVDLTLYRAAAPKCDHCGFDRRRKNTYVVEHVETSDLKQVGSNCLADFVGGVDPHRVAKYAEYLTVLDGMLDDDDGDDRGYAGMSSQFTAVPTRAYLEHVACMVRTNGWRARSAAGYGGRATADVALDNLFGMAHDVRGKGGVKLYEEPTEDDGARASAALTWAREVLPNQDRMSDFDYNMATIAAQDYLPKKGDGILAYVVVAHARALEREVKLAERKKASADSRHFGEVKQRYDLRLTVEAIFETQGNYGTTFITRMLDGDGNVFKWFGSYELDRGGVYEGKWAVKGHEEYKGTQETVLTRPTKLEKVGESEGAAPERERVEQHEREKAQHDADYRATQEARRVIGGLKTAVTETVVKFAGNGEAERVVGLVGGVGTVAQLERMLRERDDRLMEEWRVKYR